MRFFRNAALTGAALLATVAFAACGDDDDSDATNTPATTATSPAETRSPEATATRPAPTVPQATQPAPTDSPGGGAAPLCATDDLELSVLPAGGAAGTHFVALSVSNASGSDCAMVGYPGVSLTDASGNIQGEPAERNPAVGAETIVIAPGESAHAMVGLPNYQNFPAGECEGPSVNLMMYPPEETVPILVSFEDYACPGFSVRVFEPGANEPGR